jgi:hypothetical protein
MRFYVSITSPSGWVGDEQSHAATPTRPSSRSRSERMRSRSGRRPNTNNAISAISESSNRSSQNARSVSSGRSMMPSPEMQSLHRLAPLRAVLADTSLVRPQPGHSTVTIPVESDTRLRARQNSLYGLVEHRGQGRHSRVTGSADCALPPPDFPATLALALHREQVIAAEP